MEKQESNNASLVPNRRDIDIIEMMQYLWRGKWTIAGSIVAGIMIALVLIIIIPATYRSEALLAPTTNDGDALAGLAGKYGGLASLAGIDLQGIGDGGVDKTTLTLEILKSRAFLAGFVRAHDLVIPVMAATGWDADTGKWIIDQSQYDASKGEWVRDVSAPYNQEPSNLEIYERFHDDFLDVVEDVDTGLIRVAIKAYSPVAAKDWVRWLVEDINLYMRQLDIEQAKSRIEYLDRELDKTAVAQMQQIFYGLIEEETKKMMLAQVQEEYVLKIIDPPFLAEEPHFPVSWIFFVVSGIICSGISVAFVVVSSSLRK